MCHTQSTIAIGGKKCEVVPEFEGPHLPLKTAISKFVMKLLRRCDQEERESDGAMHWDSIHSKLFEIAHKEIGFKHSTKEATRRGLNTARIP